MAYGSAVSALEYDNRQYVYIQSSGGAVTELEVVGQAAQASVQMATIVGQGVPDTWITSTLVLTSGGEHEIRLIFTMPGGGITQFARRIGQGNWRKVDVLP